MGGRSQAKEKNIESESKLKMATLLFILELAVLPFTKIARERMLHVKEREQA